MSTRDGASLRGADVVARGLKAAGIDVLFSLSGNQIMPVYDACIDAGIRIVHTRHEAAAVFMADAHAQLTGRLAAAMVTAAPGFANALGAVYSARMNESPVLFLTGDSPVGLDGFGAFQELDQTAIAGPLVKRSLRPRRTAELGWMLARLASLAQSGRPGPVHMALPFDLLNGPAGPDDLPAADAMAPQPHPLAPETLSTLRARLDAAARPVVLTGPALNRSRQGALLDDLADALDAPVIAMESPRGLKDPSQGALAEALAKADCVLLLGKEIDFTLGFGRAPRFAETAPFLVVEPDAGLIGRARALLGPRLALAAQGDPLSAARALAGTEGSAPDRAAWRETVAELTARRVPAPETHAISPVDLMAAVQRALDGADDAILLSDGGEIGQWAQAFAGARSRVINGPSGAIGGVLPYAVAAKIARPEARVIAIMGDGTVGFHFAEFDTAVREGAAMLVVIGNDSRWNAEYEIQKRDFGPDRLIGCELNPDCRYDDAVAGLGGFGVRVAEKADLDAAIEAALASGLPACVNAVIDGRPAPSLAPSGTAGGH